MKKYLTEKVVKHFRTMNRHHRQDSNYLQKMACFQSEEPIFLVYYTYIEFYKVLLSLVTKLFLTEVIYEMLNGP